LFTPESVSIQYYAILFRVLEITLIVVTDAIPDIRDVDMLCGVITRISYIKHVHCLKNIEHVIELLLIFTVDSIV